MNVLLAQRARAFATHDARAFEATISPAATPAQRAAQVATLSDTAGIAWQTWSLQLSGNPVPPEGNTWTVHPTLRYSFAGETNGGVSVARTLVLTRHAGGWSVADDTSRNAPWDFGPIAALAGSASLVVAPASQRPAATHLAALADAAVPFVTQAWGAGWSQHVLVELPANAEELQALTGTTADLSPLAALQAVELPGGSAAAGSGDRILINPAVFLAKTSALGQQVIMTHEVTHVASAGATSAGMPLWLVEGLADTVGFAMTSLTPREGAPELAAAVKAHGTPSALPADSAFDPSSADVVLAYEQAWLACRLLARTVGMPALIDFYREVGGGATVAAALGSVVRTSLGHFTAAWRAALTTELG